MKLGEKEQLGHHKDTRDSLCNLLTGPGVRLDRQVSLGQAATAG